MTKFSIKLGLLVAILISVFNTGCKNNKQRFDLSSIDLLRGELVLCGGDEFGDVNFALSCNYDVREIFNTATALLHSFEYDEAEKAFVQVLDADPECAMAYWGLAMSILNHPKFGPSKKGFEKASKILEISEFVYKTTKEEDYLNAVSTYYNNNWNNTTHLIRAKKMEIPMKQLYEKYRDDKEAAIFYALSLFATANSKDKTYAKQRKAGQILESIFPDQPNHPGIAHYIIHHYDHPELAKLALNTARRYADIAPASAHAQHMPSHIFTRLGLWDESIESNLNSASSAQCYAGETNMDGHWSREIHAMDYLVYAYLQKGDNNSANEQIENWKTINIVSPSTSSPYNFGAIPIRMVLENKEWNKAAKLNYHVTSHQWKEFPWEKSLLHFARAIGSSRIGDINVAGKELDSLVSFHNELVIKEDEYRANQVLVQVKVIQGLIQHAKGNNDKAIYLIREASELEEITGKHPVTPGEVLPARELLGDILMKLKRPSEALEEYEKNLKRSPNRFNGLYGAAVAAEQSGNKEKALKYFEQLLKLTENSNSDRLELVKAKAFITNIKELT